jgi:hypothetical protein
MTDSAEPVGALEELAETVYLNETLGEPSACVAEKLFAAIDAEEARSPRRRRLHRCAEHCTQRRRRQPSQASIMATRSSSRPAASPRLAKVA